MGSQRLRGKTLMPLAGAPLLTRVLDRVGAMGFLDSVTVATSDAAADDPIAAVCAARGVACARGPEQDVLARFVAATEGLADDDAVLRFTADNPLYDADRTRQLVDAYASGGHGYAGIEGLSAHVPEVVSIGALREAHAETESAYDREHVTPFVIARPERFNALILPEDAFGLRPELSRQLTLDTPEDLQRIEALLRDVEASGEPATVEACYAWLEAHAAPEAGTVRLDGHAVGEGHPSFLVAEIGQNHNGDLATALELVEMAERCRASAVKLTKRDIASDLSREMYDRPYEGPQSFGATYGEHREALELSEDEHRTIRDHAHARGLVWFCTACDIPSVEMMERLGNPVYKVASRDLDNEPLLERIAQTGKPVILSTGMAGLEELQIALDALGDGPEAVIVLHCVSQYPTPIDRVNLRAMNTLREATGLPIGLSDHTTGLASSIAGAVMGACVVEKHVTLSRAARGTDHAGALEESGLRTLVKYIREAERAMGDGNPAADPATESARQKLSRSLTLKGPLAAGAEITEDALTLASPGTGVPWRRRGEVLGRRVARDLEAGDQIRLDDLHPASTV